MEYSIPFKKLVLNSISIQPAHSYVSGFDVAVQKLSIKKYERTHSLEKQIEDIINFKVNHKNKR